MIKQGRERRTIIRDEVDPSVANAAHQGIALEKTSIDQVLRRNQAKTICRYAEPADDYGFI
jgi:hypothetical protein